MKGLEVHGLACPWNVLNSYNELMKPGAFKQFIRDIDGDPMPMGLMHEGLAGYWTELRETGEGLMVNGVITEPFAADLFRHGHMPELSITWSHTDPLTGGMTRRRLNSKPSFRDQIVRRGIPVCEHVHVSDAVLMETSLVDSGAFPGTWVRESFKHV